MNKESLKEEIATLRSMLNYIVAFILGIGTGFIKLYADNNFNMLLYVSLFGLAFFAILFILTWQWIYKKIKILGEIE